MGQCSSTINPPRSNTSINPEKDIQTSKYKIETENYKQLLQNDDNLLEKIKILRAKNINRLKNIDIFVLDNSVRETTVAQIRGHTVDNKKKILELVAGVGGIEHQIIATFGTQPRVDDIFAKEIMKDETCKEKYKTQSFYTFTELRDEVVDGIPTKNIPIGALRAAEYGIPNLIIELDLLCNMINWNKFTMSMYCAFLQSRIDWIREKCKNNKYIFINIRDFADAWEKEPARVAYLTKYLSVLSSEHRITGIAVEDPSGGVYPWIMGDHFARTRKIMDDEGWTDGHLIIHVHNSYGLAEASVLEALLHGGTGIWCGITREGASTGHANSLTTLCNLHRMGNVNVLKKFNLAKIRQAAIDMTIIITGQLPHPMMELYGARALDICFDGSMGAGMNISEILGVVPRTRITTMTTANMFAQALTEIFGKPDEPWNIDICKMMVKTMEKDLQSGRKEEYQSTVGLFSLYERSGGTMTKAINSALSADKDMDSHPLVKQLQSYCFEWRSCRRANDQKITYLQFYEGFLAQYLKCFSCELANKIFRILDSDHNGYISWDELICRAKWVIKEYPDQCTSVETAIRTLFENYLIPECAEVIREQPDKILAITWGAPRPVTPNPPIVFATMRNCHESLRKSISEVLTPLMEIGKYSEFYEAWESHQRCLHFHARMEDLYVFPLLDELCDEKKISEIFFEEHEEDIRLSGNINKEYSETGLVSNSTFSQWKDYFLRHLQHEEKIMMPLTSQVHPSNPDRRAKVMFKQVINPLYNDSLDDFLFFVGFNIKMLSTYGSTNNTAVTATRVFAHGLQCVTTPEQWEKILPVIKTNTKSEEIWEEMVKTYFIENPGYAKY